MIGGRALHIIGMGSILAAIATPMNLDSMRYGNESPRHPETVLHTFATMSIPGLCADEERKAEARCVSFCGEGRVESFDGGVCGIGAKCTCIATVELPPEF